jgi:hypothetical protein
VVRFLCLYCRHGGHNTFGLCSLETIYAALLSVKDSPLEFVRLNGIRSKAGDRVFRGLDSLHSSDVKVKELYLDYLGPEDITTLGTLLPCFH